MDGTATINSHVLQQWCRSVDGKLVDLRMALEALSHAEGCDRDRVEKMMAALTELERHSYLMNGCCTWTEKQPPDAAHNAHSFDRGELRRQVLEFVSQPGGAHVRDMARELDSTPKKIRNAIDGLRRRGDKIVNCGRCKFVLLPGEKGRADGRRQRRC